MDVDQYRPAKVEKRNGREDSQDRPPVSDAYRRRSPAPHDRRGPRGGRPRSRSPIAIDQYRPDRSRDDHYASRDFNPRDRDDRRRAGTPPSIDRYVPGQDDPLPPPVRVNFIQPPLSLDYQVGFNYFAEWWRIEQAIKEDEERVKNGGRRSHRQSKPETKEEKDKERAQIQTAYDNYKEELQAKMAKMFVLQHKNQEWFKERYLPEVRDPFRNRLLAFRQTALDQWESDLTSGFFDSFTLEGIYKVESNGAGGVLEREEGETVAAAEVLGVGDLVPTRGGEIRDESALQPALLIKTLAPMVSRDKIEEFCKEHLGDQDGGFKWLSLSDPNPQKKCHRIGWIMLNPEPESIDIVIDRGDGRDIEDEDGEQTEQTETKSGQLSTGEKALEAINGKTIYDEVRGDFVCHVGVHIPPKEPRKKALWDLFSAPERIEKDFVLAKRIAAKFDAELGAHADAVGKVEQRVEALRQQGLLQSVGSGSNAQKKPRKKDDDEMDDGEKGESEEEGEEDEEEEGAFDEEVDDEDLLVQKKTLDLLVEYLRRVYNFCLFCVFESDSVHELIRKCPGGHLRRPRASLGSAAKAAARASAAGEAYPHKRRESNADEMMESSPVEERKPNFRNSSKTDQQLQKAFNWVKTFEEKLLQILEPENVELTKLGGMPLEEGLDEELKKFVKQEDESKFRCKVPECTKLFRSEPFWRKHVEKRHEEWFENIKTDLALINTYLLDPAHIAPSRSDANSNGHFPINNQHMATGTPRGFNLSNMPPMNAFGMGSGGPTPPGFPNFPNFGGHAVQMPPGWSGPPMMGDDGSMHHSGPMRRGGGRFQNQRSGPYDRRGPRFGGGPGGAGGMSGGLISPRGGGMGGGMMMMGRPPMAGGGGGGGKWGDGAGGGQAVGPREAVQGRSLKSYEDLDAVGGGGGGELNY